MRRPWHIWIAFALGLAVVLAALGWTSLTVLRLHHVEADAQLHAAFEENVRLALWRMDSALAPLIAQENARPYFAYSAFYPVERAYTRMFNRIQYGDVLLPSPLLHEPSPQVLLHFQLGPDGALTSPQAPTGNMRDLAESRYTRAEQVAAAAARLEQLRRFVRRDALLARLPREEAGPPLLPVLSLNNDNNNPAPLWGQALQALNVGNVTNGASAFPNSSAATLGGNGATLNPTNGATLNTANGVNLSAANPTNTFPSNPVNVSQGNSALALNGNQSGQALLNERSSVSQQVKRSAQEYQARAQISRGNFDNNQQAQAQQDQVEVDAQAQSAPAPGPGPGDKTQQPAVAQAAAPVKPGNLAGAGAEVRAGPFAPVWSDGALLLVRRVSVNRQDYVQGCWLDWPAIRTWLTVSVADLLPDAQLVPARDEDGDGQSRLLAALPVRLLPGAAPAAAETEGLGPVRGPLLIAWACVLLAALAIGAVLRGVMALSERRASFVSAVTHEMRTPLTTFRLYTEMLTEGMVTDPAKRLSYLNTLRVEAQRLGHLVENVLAYARLERGRAADRVEETTLGALLDRMESRLADRAQQAGLTLVVEVPEEARAGRVRVRGSSVEQVLFNLVDNACKYAASGPDKRLHLEAGSADGRAVLRVRDHGPGITAAEARRLFRPFSKSARQAAQSAPGVGLGLALSRRLARDMAGELRLDPHAAGSACFELLLPRA